MLSWKSYFKHLMKLRTEELRRTLTDTAFPKVFSTYLQMYFSFWQLWFVKFLFQPQMNVFSISYLHIFVWSSLSFLWMQVVTICLQICACPYENAPLRKYCESGAASSESDLITGLRSADFCCHVTCYGGGERRLPLISRYWQKHHRVFPSIIIKNGVFSLHWEKPIFAFYDTYIYGIYHTVRSG